jgi:hypothetical protein
MRNIGLTTIPVGQSIHGEWTWGSAVDFQNLGGFGATRHNWLRSNGAEYGWYQPGWAQQWGSLPEPWHWEYDQRGDAHFGEDPDVGLTPDEAQRLANIEGAVGRLETLWGAQDGRNRVHDFDLTTDWSSQTTSAVGRVETNQNDLIAQIPTVTSASHRLGILALVVGLAALVGLGVDLDHPAAEAAYAGGGTLLGGIVAWLAAGWAAVKGYRRHHRRDDEDEPHHPEHRAES